MGSRLLLALIFLVLFASPRAARAQDVVCDDCRQKLTPGFFLVRDGPFYGRWCGTCAGTHLVCSDCRTRLNWKTVAQEPVGSVRANVIEVEGYPEPQGTLCRRCQRKAEGPAAPVAPPPPTPRVQEGPPPPPPVAIETPPLRETHSGHGGGGACFGSFIMVASGLGFVLWRKSQLGMAGATRHDRIVGGLPPVRSRPARPGLDLTLGDPLAQKLRTDLMAGSFESTRAALEANRDPDEREFLIEALGEWPGTTYFAEQPDLLETWVATHPDSALPRLLRARHSIFRGWAARGGGVSSTVTAEGYRLFALYLKKADEDLAEAAKLDPTDPLPHALRVILARGRELGLDEGRRRFAEAKRLAPGHRLAHSQLLQLLARKWGGSHAIMFAFAREALAAARPDNGLGAVIVQAHAERWLYALGMAEKGDGDPYFGRAAEYWKDPAVRQEIRDAYQKSLGSPSYREVKQSAHERNYFAFALDKIEAKAEARRELERLGKRLCELPWGYEGEPTVLVAKARQRAGL